MPINKKRENINLSYRTTANRYNPHLYCLIHAGIFTKQEIANIWNVKIDTIYNTLENRTKVTPERILLLWQHRPHPQILEYFLEGSPYVLAKIDNEKTDKSITSKTLEINVEIGKLNEVVNQPINKKTLCQQIKKVEKKLAELYGKVQ